jgi:hypothetical protein
MKKTLMLCVLMSVAAGTAHAAESPWAGTWKLDPARSHLTGDTFVISNGAGALLHFSDGVIGYDFGIDGKQYKAAYDRTTRWTQEGPDAWTSVTSRGGQTLSTVQRTLSADGMTLKLHYSGSRPDGKPFDDETVYKRVSGGPGLVGTWKSVKGGSAGIPQAFIISSPAPGVLHYEVPDMQAHAEGAADGTDHPLVGGTTPAGMTISFKLITPTQVKYVVKVDGKEDSEGTQTLAADGRSFADVSWSPGKEDEKATCVYAKQ